VTGNTIFNVTAIGGVMTDADDRPAEPVKITTVEVLSNPFDDIMPR
jgi:peptidyl-prolyl cis-trans isomerase SDCCAG10